MKRIVTWFLAPAVVLIGLSLVAPQEACARRVRVRVRYSYRRPAVRVYAAPRRVYAAPRRVYVAPRRVRVYGPAYYGPRVVTPWVTVW